MTGAATPTNTPRTVASKVYVAFRNIDWKVVERRLD